MTLRNGLLAFAAVAALVACSGGGKADSAQPEGPLRFAALPAPPKAFDAAARLVENDDNVLALIDGRLYRYDPWTPGAIWLELGRDLPSAHSRLVSWNDRVWYLTTDHGRVELASVALSGEQRSDTRSVSGATDAKFAVLAARDALFVFGVDGGFRVDADGIYGAPPAYDPATRQIIIAGAVSGRTARAETYAVPPTGVTWTSTQFASFPAADGYVVEALVTAADLGIPSWDLVSGNKVGFDLGLNLSGATPDAGTQGTRIGQFFLKAEATPTGHPFQSVTAFCNPVLTAP
jgi:hypothetical protein